MLLKFAKIAEICYNVKKKRMLRYMNMKKLIEIIASFASIISLAFIACMPRWVSYLIGIVGCTCLILLVYDYFKSNQSNEVTCNSDDDIKSQMKKIIKMQGKICIMSRDLSWVDSEVEACIYAKSNSILIFAEKRTELTKRLESNSVEILYYGDLGFEPKTRFTMIRYNTSNPQVAIANTENSIRKKGNVKHVIYQTVRGKREDEWINSLASDMIFLCKASCREERYEQKS